MGDKELLQLIDGFVNPEVSEEDHIENLNVLLIRVSSGALAFPKLIQHMEDYLPNSDNIIRKRATLLLAELLTRLPALKLDTSAVHFLTSFFCDRLQDFPTIAEVIKALLALTKNHKYFEDDELRVVQSIGLEVIEQGYVASLSQAARYDLVSIFSLLLDTYPDKLRSLKSDFVLHFIRVIDGERDPRNLVRNFQTFVKIVNEIPEFTAFAEELFEVVAVYYPITFRPKPNDPYGITREMLIEGLQGCFASSPAFCQHCIPFLLDKLSSNIMQTKLDSMETLDLCIASYGGYAANTFLEDIWSALKKEVFTSKEGRVVESALKTVTNITKTLTTTTPLYLSNYLQPLITSCVSELKSVDSKIAISCGRVLQSTAAGSVPACTEVFNAAFPPLLSHFEQENRPAHRQSLLDLIVNFLEPTKQGLNTEKDTNPLKEWKDKLFHLFVGVFVADAVASSKFTTTAIDGLTTLVVSGLLDTTQVELSLQHLDKLLIDGNELMIRSQALRALHTISSGDPTFTPLLEKHTLPALFNQLESSHTKDTVKRIPKAQIEGEERKAAETEEGHSAQWVLHSLAILSGNPTLCLVVVPKLITIAQEHWTGVQTTESAQIFVGAIFDSLSEIVCPRTGSSCHPQVIAALATTHCPVLLRLLVDESASSFAVSCDSMMDEDNSSHSSKGKYYGAFLEILRSAVKIFRAVSQGLLRSPPAAAQTPFVEGIVKLYLQEEEEEEEEEEGKKKGEARGFNPFGISAPYLQRLLVLLFTDVVGSYNKELLLPNVDHLLQKLVALTHTPSPAHDEVERYDLITLAASQCIAALLNKLPDNNGDLATFLKEAVPNMLAVAKDNSADVTARTDAILTLSWVAKALVMRGNETGNTLSNELVQLLKTDASDPTGAAVARKAADAFDVILGPCDHILNTKSSTRIKILYKQKYFTLTLPVLLNEFKSASPEDKPNYLFALSHLLKHIEKSVLLNELPTILPLVIQAMSSNNRDLLVSTLHTLKMLTTEAATIVSGHLNSVVPNLLKLTRFKDSLDVRVLALECLHVLSEYPYHKIFPFKDEIVRSLKGVLDDPKRLVRRTAVKCSNQWFVLEQSDESVVGKRGGCG